MNYAEQLYKLENEKDSLLQQSRNALSNQFFCFVNIYPIGFINSKVKGVENFGSRLNFEIISFDNTHQNEFYSLTFNTTLKLDTNNHLTFSHGSRAIVKTINPKGIFFIQNYADLNEHQKKEFLRSIKDYYVRLQDKQDRYYDSVAVSALDTYHIVDYFTDNKNISLSEFINNLQTFIPNIIDKHLCSFVHQKVRENFQTTEKFYNLTDEEKQNLIIDINKNFLESVKNSLYIIKTENSYQDDSTIKHNQAVNHFNKAD